MAEIGGSQQGYHLLPGSETVTFSLSKLVTYVHAFAKKPQNMHPVGGHLPWPSQPRGQKMASHWMNLVSLLSSPDSRPFDTLATAASGRRPGRWRRSRPWGGRRRR
jgi:hypothetical protein